MTIANRVTNCHKQANCRYGRQQSGAALLMALLILLILTLIGVSGALSGLMGERMASDAKQRTDALFAAETGISRAVSRLNEDDHAAACVDGMLTGNVRATGSAHYQVDCQPIEPDQLGFCGPPYEGCYRVLSTGTVRTLGGEVLASRYVQTRVGISKGLTFDGVADAAVTCFGIGDGCYVTAEGSPGGIDGRDYGVPTAFECSGAGCRSSLDPNRNADGAVDRVGTVLWGDGSITGNPNQFNGNPATEARNDPDGAEAAWSDWAASWDELTDALGEPSVVEGSVTSTGALGTRSEPKFSRLASGVDVAGNVSGAGILLVEAGASFTGTMSFEGLVILLPGASLNTGNSTFYGAVVGWDGASINVGGNGLIRFSSEALDNAGELLGRGEAEMLSWRQL